MTNRENIAKAQIVLVGAAADEVWRAEAGQIPELEKQHKGSR